MTDFPIDRDAYKRHSLAHRARKVMTRGNTRSTLFVAPASPYAVRGAGCIVTDQFDHKTIDCNNNYTSLIHGHAVPAITEAVAETLNRGTAFGLPTESEVALSELLARRTGYEKWRFSNSGTEAVMTAIRAARAYTGRDVVIRFAGSYHGTSDGVVPTDDRGIPAGVRDDFIVVPQGDKSAYDAAISQAGDRLAAVLIDLMPNRAGLLPADAGFVQHVRNSTAKVGALMVVDEVITLRLAPDGLASTYGVCPDLITAGKIIGGGFPVGAVAGRKDVLAVFDPTDTKSVGWGGTFSANPMSMTAGRVAMEQFDANAVATLNEKGDSLRELLTAEGIAVTGSGSLMQVRETVDRTQLWWEAYQRGVLLGTNGLLALSTPMTGEHISSISTAVTAAVKAVRSKT